ncbi:MAG: tetratricopeptide repeat protein [Helicobacteraceae bacterium]|jgi:Flp pilus assembly protein TadD|nr:tetratricopeptide repeat protein [Helicobacteraceae bacterium]
MAEETNPLDSEVFIIKPDDAHDEPTEEKKPEKIKQKSQKPIFRFDAKKAKAFAQKPSVWLPIALIAIVSLFAWLVFESNAPDVAYRPPPLDGKLAVFPSRSGGELIKENVRGGTLEDMINKAAMLYSKGDVTGALDVYEQVSLFSEALSNYNLGVSRMKKGEYERAIEAFDLQIKSDRYKTAGAINAAICAINLGKEELMRRYIKIAKDNLSRESSAPLYPYYYTLISYYDNEPFGALAVSEKPAVDYMGESQNLINAKMHLLFDDAAGSVAALEKINDPKNYFAMGLLYARSGDYDNAATSLQRAIAAGVNAEKAKSALLLVYLKTGFFKDAATLINETLKQGQEPLLYPIKVKLKERLFDVTLAQNYFTEHPLIDDEVFLQALFIQVPYLMIDPQKSIMEIKKGELMLTEGELNEAEQFLKTSQNSASVGARMSAAVKLAVNNRLLSANIELKKIEKSYRNSDSLEYNLALSCAQLGDFVLAHAHFSRAYFLNRKNTEAGVYAVMLSSYAGANEERVLREISAVLMQKDDDESRFLAALLSFHNRNFQATGQWLERKDRQNNLRFLLLDLFAADQINNREELMRASKQLRELQPNDLLFAIFDLYATHKDMPAKQFAFDAQEFMKSTAYNFDPLYYNFPVVRDLYIRLALITGHLEDVRLRLINRLSIERGEVRNMMFALAILDIFANDFEESYALLNSLIDEFEMRDAKTLLYAAVAAVAAGHKANAIALLQMAKSVEPRSKEARFGLGLLYQEVGNAKGAALEYNAIESDLYESIFFDFDIKEPNDPERSPSQSE